MPLAKSDAAKYQVLMLGHIDDRATEFMARVNQGLNDLGVAGAAVFVPEGRSTELDPRLPSIAVFFGYVGARDANHPMVARLTEDSVFVIPLVSSVASVDAELPAFLRHINAIELRDQTLGLQRAASLVLETFRLVRRERRLFISYRRDDSKAVADQLYDALDGCGFDVFIDTRSVPPGADFQEELWHRLSDSDVVVLIDTPGFRESRWTTEELARANSTNIQILHLLWPGQHEDSGSAFSHFVSLSPRDFINRRARSATKRLGAGTVSSICLTAEELRARAIAARHRYLVDNFCDSARELGYSPNIHPQRWISVPLSSGKELAVVPTIGVPTSDRINSVLDSVSEANSGSGGVWILFDNRGLLPAWIKHLTWLDEYLPARSVHVAAIGDGLLRLR